MSRKTQNPSRAEAASHTVRPFILDRTEQWTRRSRFGRTFEISLARPKGAASASGYPVLYVLDPSTAFATLVETVRNHEEMYGPVVVVGIGYPSEVEQQSNRLHDMTLPTGCAALPSFHPEGAVGGADDLLAFLLEELRGDIAARISVDPNRQALFGHSLGGLFVLHALFTRAEAFDTYIAGSPSIWWGNKAVLSSLPVFKSSQRRSRARRRVLIAVGELEATVSPEELRAAAAKSINLHEVRRHTRIVSNAAALAEELATLAAHGLEVVFAKFEAETHTSVIPGYLSRGARFTLSGWFA